MGPLTALLLLVFCGSAESRLTCKDNDNNPVDWYVMYKLPVYRTMTESNEWLFPPHLYMDANNRQFVEMNNKTLNVTGQALSFTLQQAYSNHKSQDVGYIFYNDEKPDAAGGGYSEYCGHTKGVAMFDKESGVWIIHSMPKFPPPTNSTYSYPNNAIEYGQHVLCISLSGPDDVRSMGTQLMHNEPWLYDSNLPTSLQFLYPVMTEVIKGTHAKNVSSILMLNVGSSGKFTSFAKGRKFNNDLYAGLVAPTLKCNLSAETWCHGKNLPPACNQTYQVKSVGRIRNSKLKFDFKSYNDHSKFAVCQMEENGSNQGYVCIGDINRQPHQMQRGGGTVCFKDLEINQQYLTFIHSLQICRGA